LKALIPILTLIFCNSFAFQVHCRDYHASLHLQATKTLEFTIRIQNNDFFIVNGLEIIPLQKKLVPNTDSLDLVFPNFNSFLRCKIKRRKITGYWKNLQKDNYKISFSATYKSQKKEIPNAEIQGKWSVVFSPNDKPYAAVGIFEIVDNQVQGTFMTETGDYRYLSGTTQNDSLKLATFNGSHAFFFCAKISADTLKGTFFSGLHYQTDWVAVKDENAALRSPYNLTSVDQEQSLRFTFSDLNGLYYSYPNHLSKEKVAIIMLMGTWCPNCVDEAIFFKKLQSLYGKERLDIIAVCYEVSESEEKRRAAVQKFVLQNQLNFTFLVAGKASKVLAQQHFPMLNHVMSFPTTLYVDKKGVIRKIYTGFYGPATGSYHEEYTKETYSFIHDLINE